MTNTISQALTLDEPTGSLHDGTDYTLSTEYRLCWITVDSLSVQIKRIREGIIVEVFRCNEDIALGNPINLMMHSFSQTDEGERYM